LIESLRLRYTIKIRKGIIMAKVQKVYTKEFKEEAVRLAQTSGKPITQVARDLGISDTRVHQWRKELAQHGKEAFPGSGHQTPLEEENRRLKRELERVQQERDILKRAMLLRSTTANEQGYTVGERSHQQNGGVA